MQKQTGDSASALLKTASLQPTESKLDAELAKIADELDEAKDQLEKKMILDDRVKTAIGAMTDIGRSLTQFTAFLIMVYRKEGLYKFDTGSMSGNFNSDDEEFGWWLNEYLQSMVSGGVISSTLRAKLRHYVGCYNDLEAMEIYGFEKSVVLAKYSKAFAGMGLNWTDTRDPNVPKDLEDLAEQKTTTYSELVFECEKHLYVFAKMRDHGYFQPNADVTNLPNDVRQWSQEFDANPTKMGTGRKLKKGHSDERAVKTRERLVASLPPPSEAPSLVNLASAMHIIMDSIGDDFDPSSAYTDFLHLSNRCLVSGKQATPVDPIEVHHVLSRGQAGAPRSAFNLVPVVRSVHRDITNNGEKAYATYGMTVEMVMALAFCLQLDYVRYLENRDALLIPVEPVIPNIAALGDA